jgi:hypothetical protein
LGWSALIASLARTVAAAVVMGTGVAVINMVSPGGDLLTVVVAVGGGAILYLAFSQVVGLEERGIFLGLLRGTASRAGRRGGDDT